MAGIRRIGRMGRLAGAVAAGPCWAVEQTASARAEREQEREERESTRRHARCAVQRVYRREMREFAGDSGVAWRGRAAMSAGSDTRAGRALQRRIEPR
ncbi:hypothetical protein DB32_001254 [Sandaracinus amylolyticus]|uniref:Uncharacterized protein n=1 Tax=Sandaracinus amylolyticus TaxID=927083 RepID=A0A0F6W073_9BACT|nr:hypothetical protein DB32_001254 [Sandaracinus amylolyticus]